ncbi:hypothetical protein IDH41_16945 [Paenibacillus sp. IB182493]|uniref:Uncharacterized protein n=1 Tax=Paenibacillus arenilitoris TaxID=2772299 RepID=A0A927CMR8_9BACL|nr:hypothetical protein [Paenibacillus arenilitoris]
MLSKQKIVTLGFQHVLAMYAGAVIVPQRIRLAHRYYFEFVPIGPQGESLLGRNLDRSGIRRVVPVLLTQGRLFFACAGTSGVRSLVV